MKKVSILFDPKTNPIVKGAGKTFGCRLDEVPSSDVTVAFSSTNGYVTFSASLTFTIANYSTPQTFTITGVANGVVEGIKSETIQLTASGGGYSNVKSFTINICDTGLDYQFVSGFSWKKNIKITAIGDIATKRAAMINYIFDGAGLPTNAVPFSSTVGYSGTIYGVLSNAFTPYNSVDRHVFRHTDVSGFTWDNVNYHFKQTVSNGKCAFVFRGHSSELYGTEQVNELLAAGFDVWYTAMPKTLENTTTNPTVTTVGVGGHNEMITGGLDRVGYCCLKLFFFDKIEALNYLDANYSYTDYYATGCSGGGYTTTMIMAMEERFSRGVHVRGWKPYIFCDFTDEALNLRDFEQYGGLATSGARVEDFFVNTCTMFDIIAMAGSNNRTNYYSHHYADSCCFTKFTYNLWKDYYKSYLSSLSCGLDVAVNTNALYTTHGWNVNDRAIVASAFA